MQDLVTAEWSDAVEAIERCYELGWTDGLPVVPPTLERVNEFLDYAGRSPDEVLGEIPERRRVITVAKTAANAVMAGCLPEYFPVVLAATEAMLAPEFNLIAPSSSQGGAAVLVVVNGPVVQELDINSKNNLFGPGNQGQRDHRAGGQADSDERLRLDSGPVRQDGHRASGQVHLLYSGERDGLGLAAAARGARVCAGAERGDGVRVLGAETGALGVALAGSGAGYGGGRGFGVGVVAGVFGLGWRRQPARETGRGIDNDRRVGGLLGRLDEEGRARVPASSG